MEKIWAHFYARTHLPKIKCTNLYKAEVTNELK